MAMYGYVFLSLGNKLIRNMTRHEGRKHGKEKEKRIKAKRAYKPGSVENDYLSRMHITMHLKRATRVQIGPIHSTPICVCSEWGLPSRCVATPLVVSYTTVSAFLLHKQTPVWWESSFLRR